MADQNSSLEPTTSEELGMTTETKEGGITVVKVVGTVSTIVVSVLVIVLGVLGVIAGFQKALLGGAGFLAGAAVSSVVDQTEFVQQIGGGWLFNGVLRLLTGIGQIIGGIGMLLMKSWGWWIAVIATGIVLLDQVLGIFAGGLGIMDIINVLGIIIPAALLIVLLWPSIRHKYT
jgi:hypothetical protein